MTVSPTGRSRPRIAGWTLPSRPSLLAAAALVALGVGLPILVGALSGALLIPRQDDPAYRRIATELFSTGRLQLNGWSSMTLIGQIFFVQPFLWLSGGTSWAFTASTAALATAGITAGYALARQMLSVPRATLAVLGVLVFPGFLLDTTSYMTDVPTWSTEIICLGLGALALNRSGRSQWIWLTASVAVGCLAFSIREFAIAAPVAVLVVVGASGLGRRPRYWVIGAAALALCCATYLIKTHMLGLRGGIEPDLSALNPDQLREAIATSALAISPVLVVAVRSWRRQWQVPEMLVGLIAGIVVFFGPLKEVVQTGTWPSLMIGNLLAKTGSMESVALAGARPGLFPSPAWHALNLVALIAGIALFTILGAAIGAYLRSRVSRIRGGGGRLPLWDGPGSTWALMAVFATLYGIGIGAWSLVLPTYDRYLWPLALPLYALLLVPPGDPGLPGGGSPQPVAPTRRIERILHGAWAGLAATLLVALSLTSVVLVVNADAFDVARWRMGDSAVALGTPAGKVDAGFEWVTFHATGIAVDNPPPALGGFYDTLWPSFHLCALVSNSPIDSPNLTLELVEPAAYRLFLFGGPSEPLYLYRVQDPSCP